MKSANYFIWKGRMTVIKSTIAATLYFPIFFIMRVVLQKKISARAKYAFWIFGVFILFIPAVVPIHDLPGYFSSPNNLVERINYILNEVFIDIDKETEMEIQKEKQGLENIPERFLIRRKFLTNRRVYTYFDVLLWIWMIGAILLGLLFVVPYLRFYIWLCKKRVRCHTIEQQYKSVKNIYKVTGIASPCLVGSKIYLDLDNIQNERQLRHIVLHENAHYQQGDAVWNILRAVCLCLYWFHPFVWIAARWSKADAEAACDENATRNMSEEEKKSYCLTLLETATKKNFHFRKDILTAGMAQGKLSERIKGLMEKKSYKKRDYIFAVVLLMFLSAGALWIFSYGQFEHYRYHERKEEIQKEVALPPADGVCIDKAFYKNGVLVCCIDNKSGKVWRVEDYWVERLEESNWTVQVEENLQIEPSNKVWANQNLIETAVDNPKEDTVEKVVTYTKENIEKYYGELPEGIYRIVYVLREKGNSEKGLVVAKWRLSEKREQKKGKK